MDYDYYDKVFMDVLPYTREELQRNYFVHDEVVNKGIYYGAWWVYGNIDRNCKKVIFTKPLKKTLDTKINFYRFDIQN